MKMGIPAYNAACRSIVMKYAGEWEKTITRMGRWIDFENDYKTLDPSFMESVWYDHVVTSEYRLFASYLLEIKITFK